MQQRKRQEMAQPQVFLHSPVWPGQIIVLRVPGGGGRARGPVMHTRTGTSRGQRFQKIPLGNSPTKLRAAPHGLSRGPFQVMGPSPATQGQSHPLSGLRRGHTDGPWPTLRRMQGVQKASPLSGSRPRNSLLGGKTYLRYYTHRFPQY